MDKKLNLTAIICALLVTPLFANDGKKSAAPGNKFKAKKSHFLSEDAREKWLVEMRSSLPMVKRNRGPFGLLQNPATTDAPAVVQKKAAPVRSDAFLNAIKAVKVTAVLPADDKFIIGAREFLKGDVLPVIRGQRRFNVEIVSVTMDSILFKNVDTGEYVKRNLNTLPKGMSRNASIELVEGITRVGDHKPTPLNLDQ